MNRLERVRQFADDETVRGWGRRLAAVLFVLAVIGSLLIAVQELPEWQVKRASVRPTAGKQEKETTPADVAALQNEMRKTFVQVVGGAFAVIALYLTWRRVRVTEQGHITDRYTKAIEQLGVLTAEGKPNVEVRLGAIYALERIAFDSPRDHWTIMEVLTAYVRQNAPAPDGEVAEEEKKKAIAKGPATEIQAILTVLGRRRRGRGREREGQSLDLRGTDLRGANFGGAHLEKAYFWGAHVEGAKFVEAHVEKADFWGVHVEGADFAWANVEGRFRRAYVEGADFSWANVEGARFVVADMEGANFGEAHVEGADFAGASGLTVAQIKDAIGWEKANYDEEFARELGLGATETTISEEKVPPSEEGL